MLAHQLVCSCICVLNNSFCLTISCGLCSQLQMLGYDVSWAAFNIVEVMSSSKFTYKVREQRKMVLLFSFMCRWYISRWTSRLNKKLNSTFAKRMFSVNVWQSPSRSCDTPQCCTIRHNSWSESECPLHCTCKLGLDLIEWRLISINDQINNKQLCVISKQTEQHEFLFNTQSLALKHGDKRWGSY